MWSNAGQRGVEGGKEEKRGKSRRTSNIPRPSSEPLEEAGIVRDEEFSSEPTGSLAEASEGKQVDLLVVEIALAG